MFMARGLRSGHLVPVRKKNASSLSSSPYSGWTLIFGMLFMLSLIFLVLLAVRILSIPINRDTPKAHAPMMNERELDVEMRVEESRNPWVEILSWEPRLFKYHKFLTKEECKHLIKVGKPRLKKSSRRGTSNSTDPTSGAHLKRGEDQIVKRIEQRIADFSFIPIEHGEGLQVLRQDPGLEYEIHLDYLEDDVNMKDGLQRMATFLMYLSNVDGGETIFPIAVPYNFSALPAQDQLSKCAKEQGVAVKPKMGDALLWWSFLPNSKPDTLSLHGGCPASKGVKWTSTKWMRVWEWKDG